MPPNLTCGSAVGKQARVRTSSCYSSGGRTLKWFSIVDEYTRECLALVVARTLKAEDVLDVVAELFAVRGVPGHLRSDNGPEFIAQAFIPQF